MTTTEIKAIVLQALHRIAPETDPEILRFFFSPALQDSDAPVLLILKAENQ